MQFLRNCVDSRSMVVSRALMVMVATMLVAAADSHGAEDEDNPHVEKIGWFPDIGTHNHEIVASELSDWDGDGDLDVVLARKRGSVDVVINDSGVGTRTEEIGWFPWRDSRGGVNSGFNQIVDMELGDWDGDGDLDVVLAREEGSVDIAINNSEVYAGPGSHFYLESVASPWIITSRHNNPVVDMELCDWDGDGDLDAVLARAKHKIEVVINDSVS